MTLPKSFKFSKEASAARQQGTPIVALESTVLTHGLPRAPSLREPVPSEPLAATREALRREAAQADEAISTPVNNLPLNLQLARDLESIVRAEGAVPATIAVLDGRVCVGLEADELEHLAANEGARKLSSRDPRKALPSAVARRPKADEAISDSVRKLSSRDIASAVTDHASGGTTVAATLRIAAMAGIRVFATGGIGGVHRGSQWDISADLSELAKQPVLLICAGAKAILDLPATLEQLETLGVPVIGYQTDEFPAFYSIESDLPTSARVDSPEQAAALARAHWELGGGGLLLAAPPPAESAMHRAEVEAWITRALADCEAQGIHGQEVSPFLLQRVSELSGGKSLAANLALLRNNAMIAAQVAKVLDTVPKRLA